MKKKILIAGAAGQVGWSLQQTAPESVELIIPDEDIFDITNQTAISTLIEMYQPDWVINAAAYTAVDKAETETHLNHAVNAVGPELLATACQAANIPLFHYSTDYVFDGKKSTPYIETDQPNPLNEYGKAKLDGEKAIQKILPNYFILRISGVFCQHGNNFVKTMLRLFQGKEILGVVNDQITCPTSALDIATVTWKMILTEDLFYGIYHYCSTPPVSWYDFAAAILNETKKLKPVKIKTLNPITTEQFNAPAKRLKNAVLNCHKIKTAFDINQPEWLTRIKEMI